ncbi:MAG: PA2779 family protein [Gammaproteobacteria bacterium]|nr:PA2779 family protein [Gammaproteobacteria bacterium]
MSVSLMGTGILPAVSVAGIIGTQSMIEMEQTDTDRARVESFIEQENVRDQMVNLGVDPAEVKERLAALTDAELSMLNQNIDNLPAGGSSLLVVIGIVFVVLLVLEVTGVIDIFKKV